MAPHPGQPPGLRSPGGLVTLLRWEGAKIEPGVGLERWGEGRESQGGDAEGQGEDACAGHCLGSLLAPRPAPGVREWGRGQGVLRGEGAAGAGSAGRGRLTAELRALVAWGRPLGLTGAALPAPWAGGGPEAPRGSALP